MSDIFKKSINFKTQIDKDLTVKGLLKVVKNIKRMKEELLFCPLGGSGEIGMNMNLYGYGKNSIINGLLLTWE